MAQVLDSFLRDQLLDRQRRLQAAIAVPQPTAGLVALLGEVDAALDRMEAGTYGICEVCHESVEAERLIVDPLVRVCLEHLNQEQQRGLERDLELAAHMQRGLLPKHDLDLDGWQIRYHYQPLQLVSGDYCDVIARPADAGSFYLLLGDASGKGVAASMLMAQLHAIVRTLVAEGFAVHELVERVSRAFCESTLAPHFATLACARAWANGQIEICNAGHCPPLVVSGGKVTRVETAGLPVGLFCSGRYSYQRLHLAPGDSLVLYTDGLSEARNLDDREYGEGRLASLVEDGSALPPEALIDMILEDATAFREGAPASDDLAVMVVRRATS